MILSYIRTCTNDIYLFLYQAAEECLEKGISVCRDGVNYRKIGKKIRFFVCYIIKFREPK
jgi:methionine aminopeptidase